MPRLRSLVASSLLVLVSLPVAADDPLPLGDEFAVNTGTTGNQFGVRLGMADDGRFVAAWNANGDVQHRIFDSSGTGGAETTLHQFTSNVQSLVDLDVNAGGDWAGAWRTNDQFSTDSDLDVIFRSTESNGAVLADEQLASEDSTSEPTFVAVARHDDDSTTVLWQEGGVASYRRFDADGVATTDDLLAEAAAEEIDLAGLPDGSTVFVYTRDVSGTESVFARVVGADGTEQVAELPVEADLGPLIRPAVGADREAGFVAAWIDPGVTVEARLFGADGVPTSGEVLVRPLSVGTANFLDVAVAPDGSFVVVWHEGADFSSRDIWAREFARTGSPAGDPFLVNTSTGGDQEAPKVAIGERLFAVIWQGPDANLDGVFARRYERRVVFADGFESGESDYWAQTPAN